MAIAIKLREYVTVPVLLLATVSIAQVQYAGGSVTADNPATSRHVAFVFVSDQSTVIQSRELGDVYETYSIEGSFELTMDYQARTASFVRVDANLVGESPFPPSTRSLNELFNMTQLVGLIFDNTTMVFQGETAYGTDSAIQLILMLTGGKVELQGGFTPPCCDLFTYDIDGVVKYPYGGGNGEPNDPYLIYTVEEMHGMGGNPDDWDKHFKLMADIDLSDFDGKGGRPAFNVIGTSRDNAFGGVFDGNGHTISHVTVTGKDYVGLFGYVGLGGEVKNLGAVDVHITGSGRCVGGLVGFNGWGTVIHQCYSTGAVSGQYEVGGLVGENDGGIVTNCYTTGAVSGAGEVGGLVGFNDGSLTNCYSTGAVSGTGWGVGGLVGEWGDHSHMTDCFWDTQTSGQATSAGGTGKTTAQMQTASTFQVWGRCETAGIWTIDEGKDYPRLWWEKRPGEPIRLPELPDLLKGTGTQDDPFLIHTAEELNVVGLFPCDFGKHFKLMEDIDLSGFDGKDGRPAFNIIAPGRGDDIFGGTFFTGFFDGNGHRISHLTVKTSGWVGLFGRLGSGAEVKDLGVVDVNITSSGPGVGGLVGWNYGGSVTNCYSTGAVSGTGQFGYVGGLVGWNYGGSVTNCYSTGTVSGSDQSMWVGGLVGWNDGGAVTQCYSTAVVSGTGQFGYVGGLVGSNDGAVTLSFWDIQTSGQATSDGGTGRTTAQMQIASTFLKAGWDFVGETANGMEDIWWILEGKDYPRLWWEAAGDPNETTGK